MKKLSTKKKSQPHKVESGLKTGINPPSLSCVGQAYSPIRQLTDTRTICAKKSLTSQRLMRLKKPASTYSPTLKRAVPSAQVGLTSLFEMVRGGPNRHRHRKP